MRKFFLFLFLTFALSACQQSEGICTTDEGDVNTYEPAGVWKKIPDPNDEDEIANNSAKSYRLLYIAPGGASAVIDGGSFEKYKIYYNGAICEKIISDGVETVVAKAGVYAHNDLRKRLFTAIVDLENKETVPDEDRLTYEFAGSCSETKMKITQANGQAKFYTFFAKLSEQQALAVCKFN